MDTITRTLDTAEIEAHATRAGKARREGVKLYRDNQTGAHYATSVSQPGRWHYVTLLSCDCVGFVNHGHCKHHSALVIAHLLQDGGPDPETDAGLCPTCHGAGTVESKRSRWVGGGKLGYRHEWSLDVTCEACAGTGDRAPMAA